MGISRSARPAGQVRIAGLLSVAYFYSHVMGVVLPPLFSFPIPKRGLTDLQLAALILVFAVVTGIVRIPRDVPACRVAGQGVPVAVRPAPTD